MTTSEMLISGAKTGGVAFVSVMGVLFILYIMVRILQKFDEDEPSKSGAK